MEEFWSLFPILMVVAIEVVLSRWIKEREQPKDDESGGGARSAAE